MLAISGGCKNVSIQCWQYQVDVKMYQVDVQMYQVDVKISEKSWGGWVNINLSHA